MEMTCEIFMDSVVLLMLSGMKNGSLQALCLVSHEKEAGLLFGLVCRKLAVN